MTLEQAHTDFGSLESNVGILSYFDRFAPVNDEAYPRFIYDFDGVSLASLRTKYDLLGVVQGEKRLRAVNRLMHWIHDMLSLGGGSPEVPETAFAILDHAETGENSGFSCCQYAIVLAECCLSLGIPARVTNLEPFNPNIGGNHVVVTAWDENSKKWFLADAQFRAYYCDSAGVVLDPLEIRDSLVLHKPLRPSPEYDYYVARCISYLLASSRIRSDLSRDQESTVVFVPRRSRGN